MGKKLTVNLDKEVYKKLNHFISDDSSLSKFIEELIKSHVACKDIE
jgi:predicted CopG family antitoxin